MSHDLFAAFGGESTPTPTKTEHTYPVPGNDSRQIWGWNEPDEDPDQYRMRKTTDQQDEAPPPEPADEEDDFGDFEDASTSTVPQPAPSATTNERAHDFTKPPAVSQAKRFSSPSKPSRPAKPSPPSVEAATTTSQHPFAGHMDLLFEAGDDEYDAGADELTDLSNNPEAAMAYSKRIIAEQEQSRRTARTQPTAFPPKSESVERAPPNKAQKKSSYVPTSKNTEVLFDAEDVSEHEEDDFGDFEDWNDPSSSSTAATSTSQPQKSNTMPAIDLLGLEELPASSNSQQIWAQSHQTQPSRTEQKAPHVQPDDAEDDTWDDFETTAPHPQSPPPAPSAAPPPTNPAPSTHPTKTLPSSTDALPPTNIPPPTLLLTLFPPLFTSADTALFSTLPKLDLKQRQSLLSHPASHQFLRGYISHTTVLARIIAGRKLRWKRDQRLSQSMRIGPASSGASGGKGGMKLAGLDKTEMAKEDREVLDVLRLWKAQVGKLRTAVTAASAAPGLPKLPPVPELAESMPVRALKPGEGGVTAAHACALCGLRREERVAKVDVEVEDSFGEWWVQGMNMHVGCRQFWEEFERKLKSR